MLEEASIDWFGGGGEEKEVDGRYRPLGCSISYADRWNWSNWCWIMLGLFGVDMLQMGQNRRRFYRAQWRGFLRHADVRHELDGRQMEDAGELVAFLEEFLWLQDGLLALPPVVDKREVFQLAA